MNNALNGSQATTVSDEIHKQYEKAARIYCDKRGYEADLMIEVPHPQGLAVPHMVPQWTFIADDLHDLSCRLVAIKEASKDKALVS